MLLQNSKKMTIRRWSFVAKEEGRKTNVYLYETELSDFSKAVPIKTPKSKDKEDLGPIATIETTDGKSERVVQKYGSVCGLVVSVLLYISLGNIQRGEMACKPHKVNFSYTHDQRQMKRVSMVSGSPFLDC